MITKITSITAVGPFVNHRAQGRHADLAKLSLLFGENGAGKTTLSALLRSMSDNDPTPIMDRRTLGDPPGVPSVQLQCGADTLRFRDGQWDGPRPTTMIFDEEFIETRIHTDVGPTIHQRRGLFTIVLGQEGVRLKAAQDALDRALEESLAPFQRAAEDIRVLTRGADPRAFANLERDDEVAGKLLDAQRQIEAARRAQEIAARPGLAAPAIGNVPTQAVETLVGRTLDGIARDAEEQVRHHAQARLGEGGQAWIAAGVGFGVDPDCPLCGLPTEGNALIAAYNAVFSAAFGRLRAEAEALPAVVEQSLGERRIAEIAAVIDNNRRSADFWATFTDLTVAHPTPDEWATGMRALRDVLVDAVQRKRGALLDRVLPPDALAGAVQAVQRATERLDAYAAQVAAASALIEGVRANAAAANMHALQTRLAQLQLVQLRYSAEGEVAVAAFRAAETRRNELRGLRDVARAALDEYCRTEMRAVEARVNHYLEGFGARFTIGQFAGQYRGGDPNCQYVLIVRGQQVAVGGPGEPQEGPRFKTVLSCGDRRALALAFFFAILDRQPRADLEASVVVLDDPMCSLDATRRHATKREIVRLAQRTEQVIVLSHDPVFLYNVESDASDAQLSPRTLCVRERDGTALIESWNPSESVENRYFAELRILAGFLDGQNVHLPSIKRMLRTSAETWLRYQCPNSFTAADSLGRMIENIAGAAAGTPLATVQGQRAMLADINAFVVEDHHGGVEGPPPPPPNRGEIETYVRLTLRIVGWA